MYNRYIPEDASYQWVGAQESEGSNFDAAQAVSNTERRRQNPLQSILGLLTGERQGGEGGASGEGHGLSGLLRGFRLSELDLGDFLMLAVAGLILAEGEDTDLGIALILVFLFGFGEDSKENRSGKHEGTA